MKNLRRLVILGAAALSLTGCAWHNTGPCFGVGCPAWASATAPVAKATVDNAAPGAAANQTASSVAPQPASGQVSTAPAEKASKGGFFARVKAVFSPHAKTTASTSAPAGSSSGR